MKEITLQTPTTFSQIYVGDDVIARRLPILTQGQQNFVVTDSNVYALYKSWFETWFKDTEIFVLEAGESNKNFGSLYRILEQMAGAGLRRTARLFAVGGGVVGDIGGLAAALYMRGISCVQIPTTLLSQVDSSVGGKTAVDLGGIKNVVGAFYQPMEVLVDPAFLRTLPAREIKCGLGEIVKYAALSGDIFDALENSTSHDDLSFLTSLLVACIQHKARVVEQDEKETDERKSLNVGHTTGHAVELSSRLSHGECVLLGTWLETWLAIEQGVCEKTYGEKLLSIIQTALKVAPPTEYDFSLIATHAEKAKLDKKNVEDKKVYLSVAKCKNQWTGLSLPFDVYRDGLTQATTILQQRLKQVKK